MELGNGLTVEIIMNELSNPHHKSLSQKVLTYLDDDDLQLLNKVLEKCGQDNIFGQLIRTSYYIRKYLNRVDRSFYYNFYEQKQYIDLEEGHLIVLANNYSNCFLQFPNKFTQIINFIKNLVPTLQSAQDLAEQIQRMVTDTDVPLPKLKRQNQGMFCKTSFQNFLISLKYRQTAYEEGIPCFDELKDMFQGRDEQYLTNVFIKFKKQQETNKIEEISDHKKILTLRFTPYEITHQNFKQFLIQKCSLHNFLVSMFALTDMWLASLHTYLQSLDDSFHQYVELITRYSIYRNYVIQVEQMLSFTFQQYNQLYSEVFDGQKPQYRFWRAAMTKWLLKFSNLHEKAQNIYYYCFNKLRTANMLQFLSEKESQQPEIYMQIKNKLSLREYQLNINSQVFPAQISNGVEDFFKNNPQQYKVITIQFMQYMIDLSVNEETVHWCGHSEQQLSQPFTVFQKNLLGRNQQFLQYLRKCYKSQENRLTVSKQFFKSQIDFLSMIQVKPMTLRKIVQYYNLELADNPVLSQDIQLIKYDYQANDQLLKYFNTKANVKFSLNAQQLLFYSINPLVSSQQLLTKSTSTNYTTNQTQQEDDDQNSQCYFEYCSQGSVEQLEKQDTVNLPSQQMPQLVLTSKKFKHGGGLTKKMSMKYPQENVTKQQQNKYESHLQMQIVNPYQQKQGQKQQKIKIKTSQKQSQSQSHQG